MLGEGEEFRGPNKLYGNRKIFESTRFLNGQGGKPVHASPTPSPLSFLAWNFKGKDGKDNHNTLRGLIRRHSFQSHFLMKTKCKGAKLQIFYTKLGFSNSFFVDDIGHSRGLAFLWTEDIDLNCIWNEQMIIYCDVLGQTMKFCGGCLATMVCCIREKMLAFESLLGP